MIEGIPIDKCVDMDVKIREHISELIMRLCLKELFEFQFMQTDPNWSNFFYNINTKQVLYIYICNNYILCNFNQGCSNGYIFAVNFIGFWGMQDV